MRLVIFLDAVVHVAADEEIKIVKKKKKKNGKWDFLYEREFWKSTIVV